MKCLSHLLLCIKLNLVIEQNDSDFTDFTNAIDHDYNLPYVKKCLMYFVTGTICKDFTKFTKCEVCRTAFFESEGSAFIANHPVARIVTFDKDQDLQHPNVRLFKFLEEVEEIFSKHCKRGNVYDLVVNEITERQFKFSCVSHAQDVLAYILHYYLQLRMRQYAKIQIADQKKESSKLKKLSKLYLT